MRFFSGLAWGFIALSAFVLVLWKAHLLAFDGELLHGGDILKYAFGWGLVFLMVAVFEESTLRGYLQFTLTRGIGFWWGALLLSLLFGFCHGTNPGETPVGLFAAAAVGLVFCLSLWYTGSLWWAVGFHASWDWAESYFYGTSDSGLVAQGHLFGEHPIGPRLWSGGTTGPEGSLLVLCLLVVIAGLMWLWWGRRVQSPFRNSGWKPAWLRKPAKFGPSTIGRPDPPFRYRPPVPQTLAGPCAWSNFPSRARRESVAATTDSAFTSKWRRRYSRLSLRPKPSVPSDTSRVESQGAS